jgi:hypothetical protein
LLTEIDVVGVPHRPSLVLPIVNAEDELIQVKNVDGIEPVKASVSTSPYGVVSGEAITGTSVGTRNIVLTLGLNPDWDTQTYEELRKELYKYFMPQQKITLYFESTHLPRCMIDGVVESMAPNIFSKDPEAQISIICGRPEFIATDVSNITGHVNDSRIEFEYEGSAKTGMTVVITPSATRGAYTGSLTIHIEDLLIILDDVTIDNTHGLELKSVPGSKHVKDPISGANLLGRVRDGYSWPYIAPGINSFIITADLPGQNWAMSYIAMFGGL